MTYWSQNTLWVLCNISLFLHRHSVKTETVDGETHVFAYTYDLVGRLTDVEKNDVNVEHYEYDPNGNRLQAVVYGVASDATDDDQDRLLTYGDFAYTYTNNGELLTKTDTADGEATTYDYDVFGNLRQVWLPNWNINSLGITAAHEAGHLMNLVDLYERGSGTPFPGFENDIMATVNPNKNPAPSAFDVESILSRNEVSECCE